MALSSVRSLSSVKAAPSLATLTVLESALRSLRISSGEGFHPSQTSKRYASHQAQGRANGAKDGPGKRLGAKKTAGEYVVPGNILFKQRGTLWFPGDNCYMGRDHTIHAGAPGYVRYYRDPAQPRRKFIGIVFEKEQTLPQPANAARRRKLGMLAHRMPDMDEMSDTGKIVTTKAPVGGPIDATNEYRLHSTVRTVVFSRPTAPARQIATRGPRISLRPGYQYREANWEIGRTAERAEAAAQAVGRTTRTYPDFHRGRNVARYRKTMGKRAKKLDQQASNSRRAAKKRSKQSKKP